MHSVAFAGVRNNENQLITRGFLRSPGFDGIFQRISQWFFKWIFQRIINGYRSLDSGFRCLDSVSVKRIPAQVSGIRLALTGFWPSHVFSFAAVRRSRTSLSGSVYSGTLPFGFTITFFATSLAKASLIADLENGRSWLSCFGDIL